MPLSARPLALALLALAACERAPADGRAVMDLRHTRNPSAPPAVSWAGDAVTTDEVARRFREMSPALRERYQSPQARREYVEALARFDVLVREALSRGLQDDPEVVEATKRALVNRLMRAKLEEASIAVSDADVEAAYAARREDFVRPEVVRLSHVFLAAPRSDVARVAKARERAEAVRAQALALAPDDFAAFGKLARGVSEEPRTAPLDGDLRFLSDAELTQELGPEVTAAARALTTEGALSGVVQTDAGLHVLKLRARRPALDVPLEEAREGLRVRLEGEQRARSWASYLEDASRRLALKVDTAALDAVPLDVGGPMEKPVGPPPGTVPPP
ncbi:peptidyl-prolyl cis-trans isomerase [Myxococcaceae bacterium JPH2]|nr:peptidyl-prolyl cis-trans isomerase [Myxococcaceae bacterium JPH2]